MDFSEKVMDLCERVSKITKQLVAEVAQLGKLTLTENGMFEPKILGFLLVCRTITNFEAVILLSKQRLVVEARAIARCCLENLFLIAGLQQGGIAFAQKMKEDDEAGRKSRLKFAQSTGEIFDSLEPEMQKAVADALDKAEKSSFLTPKSASNMGSFRGAYLAHSQISGDAAHATLTALARYWSWGSDGLPEFDVQPEAKKSEIDQTLLFTAMAVLGLVQTMDAMFGGLPLGQYLPALTEQFQALQNEEA